MKKTLLKTTMVLALLSSPALAAQPIDNAYSFWQSDEVIATPVTVTVPVHQANLQQPVAPVQTQPSQAAQQNNIHKTDLTLTELF